MNLTKNTYKTMLKVAKAEEREEYEKELARNNALRSEKQNRQNRIVKRVKYLYKIRYALQKPICTDQVHLVSNLYTCPACRHTLQKEYVEFSTCIGYGGTIYTRYFCRNCDYEYGDIEKWYGGIGE